jgi:hypothetical protein
VNGVSISRPGAVFRPGRVDALPIGAPPEAVTVLTDDLSDFARFVAPVRGELAAHRWILHCDEVYLRFPDDEGWQRERSAILAESSGTESWRYVEGRFLEAVADTLIDEWWDFFAVDRPVEDLDGWVRDFWAAARSRTLVQYLIDWTPFFCAGIDGVRWDFFSPDPGLIGAIHDQAGAHPGVQVRRTDLDSFIRSLYYGGESS